MWMNNYFGKIFCLLEQNIKKMVDRLYFPQHRKYILFKVVKGLILINDFFDDIA